MGMPLAILTACEMVRSNVTSAPLIVKPQLEQYSPEISNAVADWMENNPKGPCPRDYVFEECDPVKRYIIDYGNLRKDIKEL